MVSLCNVTNTMKLCKSFTNGNRVCRNLLCAHGNFVDERCILRVKANDREQMKTRYGFHPDKIFLTETMKTTPYEFQSKLTKHLDVHWKDARFGLEITKLLDKPYLVDGYKLENIMLASSDSGNKGDGCKKDEKKKEDPCKKDEKKKEDPCKKDEKKKEDPCKKDEKKKVDPCKKKDDICKKNEKDSCKKKDPCEEKIEKRGKKKIEEPCKKKEDPCKKKDDICKKKKDPCQKDKKEEKKKEDPCKKDEKKKEDPCKKDEKKKEDPCKKDEKKDDPCKKKCQNLNDKLSNLSLYNLPTSTILLSSKTASLPLMRRFGTLKPNRYFNANLSSSRQKS